MTSDPGAGERPATLTVLLAVAWLRLVRLAMRHRVITPARAMRLATPFYWAADDAGADGDGMAGSN